MQERLRKVGGELLENLERRLLKGDKIKFIAEDWGVSDKAIYYWCKKYDLDPVEIKKKRRAGLSLEPKRYSYSYYVNQAYKRGDINIKQKRRYLKKFYTNRGKVFVVEGTVLDYNREEELND